MNETMRTVLEFVFTGTSGICICGLVGFMVGWCAVKTIVKLQRRWPMSWLADDAIGCMVSLFLGIMGALLWVALSFGVSYMLQVH